MATIAARQITAEEFYEWLSRPENQDKTYELEAGEIVEMPPPGEFHGVACFLIVHLLGNYVFQRGQGYLTINDAGLLVKRDPDTVRGPDVMLFTEKRPLEGMNRKFTERVPQLVVEVLSPSDQQTKVIRRISQYLQRGVPLVWLVDPEVRGVTVFRSGKDVFVLDEKDLVTGEDVLPDLRIRVGDLFTTPGHQAEAC